MAPKISIDGTHWTFVVRCNLCSYRAVTNTKLHAETMAARHIRRVHPGNAPTLSGLQRRPRRRVK